MIRVLICDDAAAFSILAEQWIDSCPDLQVIGIVHSGPELLAVLETTAPHVIVLDHLLGEIDSAELTPLIRSLQGEVGIVLMSGMLPEVLADLAARAGTDAFISKATGPDAFCDTIRHVGNQTNRGQQ
ncbi:MAG: response regulator transcription factor [Solirubrobacterales bacterium]|nr:response regulator transcription factor [Solirubrobacterales bacterium]